MRHAVQLFQRLIAIQPDEAFEFSKRQQLGGNRVARPFPIDAGKVFNVRFRYEVERSARPENPGVAHGL